MEQNTEISKVELEKILLEETRKFLAENRNEIIKRAQSRLRQVVKERQQKDA